MKQGTRTFLLELAELMESHGVSFGAAMRFIPYDEHGGHTVTMSVATETIDFDTDDIYYTDVRELALGDD